MTRLISHVLISPLYFKLQCRQIMIIRPKDFGIKLGPQAIDPELIVVNPSLLESIPPNILRQRLGQGGKSPQLPVVYPFEQDGRIVYVSPLAETEEFGPEVYVDIVTQDTAARINRALKASPAPQSLLVHEILTTENDFKRNRKGGNSSWLGQRLGKSDRMIKHRRALGKAPESLRNCVENGLIKFADATKLLTACHTDDLDPDELCFSLLNKFEIGDNNGVKDFLLKNYRSIYDSIFKEKSLTPSAASLRTCLRAISSIRSRFDALDNEGRRRVLDNLAELLDDLDPL